MNAAPNMLLFVICELFLTLQLCASQNEHPGAGVSCHVDNDPNHSSNAVEPIAYGLQTVAEENNDSVWCECREYFGGLVECDNSSGPSLVPKPSPHERAKWCGPSLKLALCYCLTSYANDPNSTIIGACLYHCYRKNIIFSIHWTNATGLTDAQCSRMGREGQLCGKCKTGYSPPVYYYNLECVHCPLHDNHTKRWAKYIFIAFLPLTIFFLLVTTLHISATSPSMNALILASQILASPVRERVYSLWGHNYYYQVDIITLSFYGIWNLDFFRSLYPPFCIHPSMNTLQVLALDYIIAAYPLFLIVVTYALVELHDRNFIFVAWLWKPFRRCFISFRRYWNVKTSLIDAFATFLLLSYVKFLSVSFDLLTPVQLITVNGDTINDTYLYYDATIPYFGKQHLPYVILAIMVLILFNFLPIVLLCLYPCQCFQKLLNCCRLRCTALHTFMDVFQGCYKNRTDGTYDRRWFSAVYLIIRVVCYGIGAATHYGTRLLVYGSIVLIICVIMIGVTQPYKSYIYNSIDTALILILAVCGLSTILLDENQSSFEKLVPTAIQCTCALVPLVYLLAISTHWILIQKRVPQRLCHMIWKLLLPCKRLVRKRNLDESLPDRLVNPEECAALLQDPMAV